MTVANEKVTEKKVTSKQDSLPAPISIFEEDASGGLENITPEDLTIPRLKILQALSPEVNKIDGKYVQGAAAGDIFNTVTSRFYSESEQCIVIPVAYKRMFLEWQPRESGGGLVNQHTDAAILSQASKNEKGAHILENGNYIQTSATHYCLVVEGDSFQQVMIPMAGTQLKKSRTWNSVMMGLKVKSSNGNVFTPPSYSHKYALSTVAETNDLGTWFGWSIEIVGTLEEGEMFLYDAAKYFANNISNEGGSLTGSATSEAAF